ncbi:MAG TPA: quinolinate synthase NadA, partial [Agitococcus sp.]|nr:quinolinate synthase NadA [Agitococcus sp.]
MNNLIDNAAKQLVKQHLDHLHIPEEASLSPERKAELIAKIKRLLQEKDAVLVAHYYTSHDLQA